MGPKEEAQKALQIFDDMASNYKLIAESGKYDKNHKTWLDWHGANTTDPVGYMAFLASRLIQQENIATDEARN